MQRTSPEITMHLVLLALFLITISEGFNISEVRHKRNDDATMPNILKIKYHHQDQVKLVVLKKVVDSTLVGSYTPLWFIESDGAISDEQKLYDGPSDLPTFYHGDHSLSAVTYFPRSQTLHGVLDQSIYVENLPLHNVNDPDLVNPFLHPIPHELESKMNVRKKRLTSGKRKSSEGVQCSSREKFKQDNQKKSLYPEIFLIVDVSSRRIGAAEQDQYNEAIMYVLTYWNAVDMLFRNLQRTNIKLNIAGILMGKRQDLEISGLVAAADMREHNSHVFVSSEMALKTFGAYFHRHSIIERDSYDFLIWMTNTTLIDADILYQEDEDLESAMKDYSLVAIQADCGGMHRDEIISGTILNRAIVMYDDDYAQYHFAARGLARLMFVPDDDVVVVHDFHNSNCLPTRPMLESSGIMDPSNKRLEGYLFWSYCSEIHFERYSRSKSSCCTLNYPSRTLPLPDPPHYVTVKTQCECYGMKAPYAIIYGETFCEEPLRCESRNGRLEEVAMPLDGTPCEIDVGQDRSFCNDKECP